MADACARGRAPRRLPPRSAGPPTSSDGKLDPTEWNRAVKSAATSGVDGIYDISGNPNVMGDAMSVVRAKHIPFVLAEQSPAAGDQGGIDSYIDPDPVAGGKIIAQWVASDSGNKAHVLVLGIPGYADIVTRNNALVDGLKTDCNGKCVTYHSDVSTATMGTSLAPLVTSQLQQHPDINYVWVRRRCDLRLRRSRHSAGR